MTPWTVAQQASLSMGFLGKNTGVGCHFLLQVEINPEYSLEGLMLKLKLQYFGQLMQSADSLEKTLILGKTEGKS